MQHLTGWLECGIKTATNHEVRAKLLAELPAGCRADVIQEEGRKKIQTIFSGVWGHQLTVELVMRLAQDLGSEGSECEQVRTASVCSVLIRSVSNNC